MNRTSKLHQRPSVVVLIVCAAALSTSSSAISADKNKPNLEGMWTAGTLTPLERPPELANRSHYDAKDLDELQRQSIERFWQAGHRAGDVGRDNDAFLDNNQKILSSGQTSLVVEPKDGRVQILPAVESRRDFNLSNFDSFERMSQWDRCITRQPTTMIPVSYNNAYQIIQSPTHVVIVAEMIHDTRIIPIDPNSGGKHIDARIRSWEGDSRGYWEGNTLVVDTTNFSDRGWILTGSNGGRLRGVPVSTELHTIERFTRVNDNTLAYEISIEDPQAYRSTWKVSYPLQRDDSYRMYEYACHEGNDAVASILRGARVQERSAAQK